MPIKQLCRAERGLREVRATKPGEGRDADKTADIGRELMVHFYA
jgi:hypothetical protein